MKGLRRFVDKIKPPFEKGGKLHFLHSTFDAFETFLFVPNTVTKKGAHIRDVIDMKRTMIMVVIAVMPLMLFGMFNIGIQHYLLQPEFSGNTWQTIIPEVGFWKILWYGVLKFLPLIVGSYVAGLGAEFIFAQVRGHEVNEGFLVSGILIPLIIPPTTPLWMVALATIFAVIFGKEVFGGTGMNIVNPALLARAFLFFAYPAHMSGDAPWVASGSADIISGPTPLASAASGTFENFPSVMDMFIGFMPGSVGETSALLILLGGLFLVMTGIGSFRIMASVFAGGFGMALLFNLWGANAYMDMPAFYHLIIGGFAFGAVFMATDPVSAAQTPRGKIIYGVLIGVFSVLLRVLNPAYPEGMMLAILFMNVMAPMIDHYVLAGNIKRRQKRLKTIKTEEV
ncbi:MAG: NADH:ubiquinone reductase (Na(+)-transporting) subunit B [Marinilabiliales bacterium]|nr:MAG: NADH:ubiquinone reductase (Na(+)-transporting) subunit B [Marinilabiliales bacterium]